MPHKDPHTGEMKFQPSTIETVDYAATNWLKDMKIQANTNEGWKPVVVQWVTPERAYSVKKNRDVRDKGGALIMPIMSIERTGIEKDLSRRGAWWGHGTQTSEHVGGSFTIAKRINQQKTSNFASADAKYSKGQFNYPRKNKKVVYETVTVPMPVFIDVTYKISVRAEYQQQMNEIIQPFVVKTGGINHFIVEHENHRFETFMGSDFTQESNVAEIGEEEAYYQTTFEIKVLGYLIGGGKNDDQPTVVVKENAVDIKIGRERVILGDVISHPEVNKNNAGIDGKYRG
jgi:hypothetical protein